MEEIHEISRKYKLFVRLAEEERRSGENEELIASETAAQCERRWWKTIEAMPQDQLEELYKYYVDVDDNGMTMHERHRFYDD